MGQPFYLDGSRQVENLGGIDAGRLEQLVGEGTLQGVRSGGYRQPRVFEENPARQSVAVGMKTGGGKAYYRVTGRDRLAIDDVRPFDRADAEASEIIFASPVEPRQLRGLPSEQGATGDLASAADSFDHLRRLVDIKSRGREIVEKEEGLGAGGDHVVDRHRHEIDPDRRMAVHGEGDLQLRPHSVRAGHQHRLAVFSRWQGEQSAEPADAGHHFGSLGPGGNRLDSLHQRIPGLDVHSRIFVGSHVCAFYRL